MFEFLNDLCESRLIPSKTSLKNWDAKKIAELAYLYFLSLRILLCDSKEKQWARDYCKKAGANNDFATWRSSANDMYVFLYALTADPDSDTEMDEKALKKIHISPPVLRHWFRHVSTHDDEEATHKLLTRLDSMFHIDNSSMKSMRRVVVGWDDAEEKERADVLTKLIQMIHARAPSNSEILSHLRAVKKIEESATTGGTSAASVATVVGGLGAGFDPNGDRGVYSGKPIVIRRSPAVKKKT